ncbi:MAG: hypothetical protein WCW52_00455 [Elusimicrobiales bacterium]|jgi:hypothetical protein
MSNNDSDKQPAAKGDLELVKTELNGRINSVEDKLEKVYLSQVQADSKLHKKMDILSAKMDKLYSGLMSAFEKTIFKGEKYDQKAATHADMLTDHTDKLTDHETRIALLETAK